MPLTNNYYAITQEAMSKPDRSQVEPRPLDQVDEYELASEEEEEEDEKDEATCFTSTIHGSQTGPQPRPSTSRASLHVSVQRDAISSTRVQEGDDELQGLDVDAYDQQTYEKSVFDQVDRAITEADVAAAARQREPSGTNIGDLMRVIHNQSDDEDNLDNVLSSQDKDEQVVQLTRLERLNRTIKVEPTENAQDPEQPQTSLPRIPKIQRIVKSEINAETDKPANHSETSTGRTSSHTTFNCKNEHLKSPTQEGQISSEESNDDSLLSDYQPIEISSTDDEYDEGIEYDDDNEPQEVNPDEDFDSNEVRGKKIRDDGDLKAYSARVKAYTRERAKLRLANIMEDGTEFKKLDEMVRIEGNLKIPKDIWDNLYEHQKTGVRWLWELHQLGCGGILGDEMGLGKTIQMIAFLVALRTSNIVSTHKNYNNLGPTVLICPATVMHQWLAEFRKWYPPFRVAILHNTGSFSGDRKQLVKVIHKSNGILICSYPGVIIYQDYLHALDWHYAILDEGHKIKNPDAQVTLACKRFRTPHRIILSGSPVQNNLRELWSIFDFIYPGKLGTLPVFMGQFSIPITQGGYANATDMQVQIAYKCACVLRDTIKPFLLRRTKAEVNSKLKLPDRSEQVLFCKLTERQRKLYEYYLDSPTVRDIKKGMCQIFIGLIQLRKICNHPDLFDASECSRQLRERKKKEEKGLRHMEFFSSDETYGHYQKSGKMMVVDALLKLWKKQNHKVLLFTQSRQMIRIFTNYLKERNYKFLAMDGATQIGARHSLIDEFNKNDEIFIFLLTTRVGGVGVNLIGANRIIIYDPDWNPSTDIQARERAWRIGQQRHVIIYRLLTAGTIEEKIYHRQVFKLYLTNRVLRDAKQKRFFKTNDMHELFTLGHDDKNIETKALFDDDLQIDEKSIRKQKELSKVRKEKKKKMRQPSGDENLVNASNPIISEEKLKEMRERAKRLSQMIASQYGGQTNGGSQNETQVKMETISICSEEQPVESGSKKIKIENSRPLSPSQPVPYCPARQQSSEPVERLTGSRGKPNDKARSSKKRVDYLVRQDIYKPDKSSDEKELDPRYKRDDYILERLFKNSNIFGALKHDKIEGDSTSDFKIVESEAEKVARDAIKCLRESRRMCLGSTSGIPFWTGQNGRLAASERPRLVPKNKSRAQQLILNSASTMSSSSDDSILTSIMKRNQKNPVNLVRNLQGGSPDSDEEEHNRDLVGRAKSSGVDQMAEKIREFVLYKSSRNGEAQTDELLEFFRSHFQRDKAAIFKAILYKMCEFQRIGNKGFWRLRTEFREL